MPDGSNASIGVPQWLFAIFFTSILGVLGGGILAVVVMRDQLRDHDTALRVVNDKLAVLEKRTQDSAGVEGRLIAVEAKLDIILKAVLPPPKGK